MGTETNDHREDSEGQKHPYFSAYASLKDPWSYLWLRGLLSALTVAGIYFVFGWLLPARPEWFYPVCKWAVSDVEEFKLLVENHVAVEPVYRFERMTFVIYVALYCVMWFTYFQSRIPDKNYCSQAKDETSVTVGDGLEIQSLRRLLGISCESWQAPTNSEVNAELVAAYRTKAGASMEVIAILIAVSTLILDQFASIWRAEAQPSLWVALILWSGLASTMIACIGFLLAVDALDTTFNRFRTKYVRDRAINYFYRYAINPRYAGNASLLLAFALLLAYHNVMLGSMTIGLIIAVGYDFWFPRLGNLATAPGTPIRDFRKNTTLALTIFVVSPILVKLLSWVIHA